jgi:probable F420-dependent oxidoreductase
VRLDAYSFGRPLPEVGPLAADAEAIGFDGLWAAEAQHNPFLQVAAAGLATERLMVGTNVAVAFARSPMVTAQAAWDLAEATGGRFVLGLGSQVKAHVVRRFSAEFSHPGPRLREYVLALRHIFAAFGRQTPLKFEGEFYRFNLLTPFFAPDPTMAWPIPIYLAGVNRFMARIAGEVADGLCVHPLHSPRYLAAVVRPAVAEGAAAAGRATEDVSLVVPVFCITGATPAEVDAQRRSVRQQLAFYGSTPAYRPVFALHGWEAAAAELSRLQRRGQVDQMAACVTDEILDEFAVSAPWDGLASALVARYRGLADRVVPYGTAGDWLEQPALVEAWSAVASEVHATSG